MFSVNLGSGAILFTNGVRMARIAEGLYVRFTNLGWKYRRRRSPLVESAVDDGISSHSKNALRQRFRLGQQRPWPEAQCEIGIGSFPSDAGRHHIEHGKPCDMPGMIKRHSIGHASAAIMSGNREAFKTQLFHHAHQLASHRPLRIGHVFRIGGRTAALTIARQIGADDGEVGREQWRNIAPHQMGLRKAMQQKERWPIT